jgi:dsRNA-specific ribonuclease
VPLVTSETKKTPRRRRKTPPGFEDRIGYKFKDVALLEQALTHISALAGPRNRASSYQRLEFLGDHVLGLVISDMLYGAFPKADEGELSRRLADLVRKEACADVAKEIELGAAIRLGASENNGRRHVRYATPRPFFRNGRRRAGCRRRPTGRSSARGRTTIRSSA